MNAAPADAVELTALPEIGDRLYVRDTTTGEWLACTVISMAKCRELHPKLWRQFDPPIKEAPYPADETIRAFVFDDAAHPASFCIMRFPKVDRHYYNSNVRRIG